MSKEIKILVFGDVVGNLGCVAFQKHVQQLKKQHQASFVIVNGENSSGNGRGITPRLVQFFKHSGADVITSGNHIWACKDIIEYVDNHDDLLRPANFPGGTPGKGVTTLFKDGVTLAVVNLQGRIFMRELVDCPLRAAESLMTYLKSKADIVLVDFHAETTSEKMAMGHYLDGKVAGVVGTHTHVQTADERVLPGGTAFITDLGMCGALNGMLGMRKDIIINQMLTQMPHRFMVDNEPPAVVSGVCITADSETGLATAIERFRVIDNEIIG
jgi:metallophosphoesterase (TIGR00282 family)